MKGKDYDQNSLNQAMAKLLFLDKESKGSTLLSAIAYFFKKFLTYLFYVEKNLIYSFLFPF